MKHVLAALEEYEQRRRVVVRPWVRLDSIFPKLTLIDLAVTQVEYGIAARVVLVEELHHIVYAISIQLLGSRGGREAHPEHPLCDI